MMAAPRWATYTSADLIRMLMRYGPLWAAGEWYGFGHVVVITGVKDETVYINDPDRGTKKSGTISWFNQRILNTFNGCLMFKDPNAY